MIENMIILEILKCVAVIDYSNKITKFITISNHYIIRIIVYIRLNKKNIFLKLNTTLFY